MISFPQVPEYTIGSVLKFSENSRRYSQLEGASPGLLTPVANEKKIFNHKSFNYFFGTPLCSRINIQINFFLQVVHFTMSAVWYCSLYLPLVSTTQAVPVAKFATGVIDSGSKFATGVVYTSGKFATGVVNTAGAPSFANIS
jgi:hypothetical protein